jgi:Ca-activated chloride channel family protein
MNDAGFHFAQPWWLLLLLLIPAVLAWLRFSQPLRKRGQEYKYADAELLPHLTGEVSGRHRRDWRVLGGWSLAWLLMTLAMAGPRWDYERISAFQPAAELVVLLDISASMKIKDVRPSRLARAKQEVQDLLRLNPGIRIGLVAFATVAHVVAPLTEDMESLRRVLPGLSTDLVRLPGSRLGNALEKAAMLFTPEQDDKRISRHILLITDGDFDEPGLADRIAKLREEGIHLDVLGVGTEGGGPVPYLTAPGGQAIISRLNPAELERLARWGDGRYRLAEFHDRDVQAVLDAVLADADKVQVEGQPTRIWNERFYLPLIPAVLLILWLFGPTGRFARGAS